jgi:hypothetical protein
MDMYSSQQAHVRLLRREAYKGSQRELVLDMSTIEPGDWILINDKDGLHESWTVVVEIESRFVDGSVRPYDVVYMVADHGHSDYPVYMDEVGEHLRIHTGDDDE